MANSKDRSFLPLHRILTRGVSQLTILIVFALLGVFAISQPAVAELIAFENFQCVSSDTPAKDNNLGAGFGFSDYWTTSSSNVTIACGDVTMNFPAAIPLNKSLNNGGKGNLFNAHDTGWSQNTLTRPLSNSIDFSQQGEYYLSYNQVQWGGESNNAFITVGIGNSAATGTVQVGRTWTNHSDALYTTGAGYPAVSGIENAFTLSAGYTVLAKITVSGTGENTVSYKVLGANGTLPNNAADVEWDATKTFTSTGIYNQIEARFDSKNGYLQINEIRLGTSYGDVTGFLDNPQAGTFTGLAQRSIGLNFTGQNASGDSEKALATSDFAGADGYVQALWNNIRETTTTGVPYSMLDSVGSMEYYKNQSGYMTVGYTSESQSLDSLAGTDANSALMSGHANGSTQVTLGSIPYDYYDVVVYMGDNADSTGQYWITDSEGNKISDTISVASGAFDGTWTQVKSSGDSGNYYVFRGLTTPSMILNSADGPINAVQIVGHNSTMYLADGNWSNELTVDGVAYQGVQFDSQTSADAKTASHAAGVVLNDNATFQVGNGYTLTQSAPITGTGSVDKTGEGTLVLSGANTYDGETNVYGGTLQLTGDAIDNANGSFTVGTGGTLEFYVASGDERTVTFTDATVIGNGDILKTGEGRLKINTDELDQATADLHFTADNFVVASGRLDLEGYMLGNIEVDANTVFSPGNSIGEATFGGGYILKDGATLLLEVGKDSDNNILFDVLNVTGDTTFENGSIIKIALDSSYENAFEDEDVANIQLPLGIKGSDGNPLNMDNIVFQSSLFDLVGYNAGTGYLSVVYSAPAAGVPEPSTWALLALGVVVLFLRKRVRN